jgi:hypothetical protein
MGKSINIYLELLFYSSSSSDGSRHEKKRTRSLQKLANSFKQGGKHAKILSTLHGYFLPILSCASKKVLNDVVPHTECGPLAAGTFLLYFSHIQESDLLIVPLICVVRWQLRLRLLSEKDEHVV